MKPFSEKSLFRLHKFQLCSMISDNSFNPLSANVEYTPHERLVQAKSLKMALMFLNNEKTCYEIVYYTSYLR